jgi:hypothetical protein
MRTLAALIALAVASTAAPARAQQPVTPTTPTIPTTPGATAFTASDFLIRIERKADDGTWTFMTDIEAMRFFNRARCVCGDEVRVRVDLSPTGNAKVTANTVGTVKVFVNTTPECVSATLSVRSAAKCLKLGGDTTRLASLKTSSVELPVTVNQLFVASNTGAGCMQEITQAIWLFVDTTNTGAPDSALADSSAPTLALSLDGLAPTAPTGVKATPGGEALEVSWDEVTGFHDFLGGGYLVFCARAGQLPVFSPSYYTNQYLSAATESAAGMCAATGSTTAPLTAAQDLLEAPLETADPQGTKVAPPAAFTALDPTFLCSDLLTSQTSIRISGLQNGVPYVVGVASVDRTGNASPITEATVQFPVPTSDFYSAYRKAGGSADGGFCALGGRPSSGLAALVAVAGAALCIRRRRQPQRRS